MPRIVVDVKARKRRTEYQNGIGVLETIRKERQETNKKMLSDYQNQIKKVISAR